MRAISTGAVRLSRGDLERAKADLTKTVRRVAKESGAQAEAVLQRVRKAGGAAIARFAAGASETSPISPIADRVEARIGAATVLAIDLARRGGNRDGYLDGNEILSQAPRVPFALSWESPYPQVWRPRQWGTNIEEVQALARHAHALKSR